MRFVKKGIWFGFLKSKQTTMKNQLIKYSQNIFIFFLAMSVSLNSYAQDGGLDIDINIGKPEWYEQTWVWVVGAAVFVLVLVAILRKKK
jgi:hypothetical protein